MIRHVCRMLGIELQLKFENYYHHSRYSSVNLDNFDSENLYDYEQENNQ